MLCELAEKLMRSGHEQARPLWQQARADYSDDVWVYVEAGIEDGDLGDHAEALEWLTTGWNWRGAPVTRRAPWSSCARCARPAWPRSGGWADECSSTRPRGSTVSGRGGAEALPRPRSRRAR